MHTYNPIAGETETGGSLASGAKERKTLAKSLSSRQVREVLK